MEQFSSSHTHCKLAYIWINDVCTWLFGIYSTDPVEPCLFYKQLCSKLRYRSQTMSAVKGFLFCFECWQPPTMGGGWLPMPIAHPYQSPYRQLIQLDIWSRFIYFLRQIMVSIPKGGCKKAEKAEEKKFMPAKGYHRWQRGEGGSTICWQSLKNGGGGVQTGWQSNS